MSKDIPGTAGIEVTHEPETPVQLVQLWLCDPCLDGEGEQCLTPGCSLWIHNVPKPALRGSQGVTILGPALEPFMTREDFAARKAGQAEYEVWRAAIPDVVCNVPGGPWEELPATVQAGFAAIAARQPALATVDLHRWYAVITQPNGMTKVIGHTSDGLGYYDSVDEWEAKNS